MDDEERTGQSQDEEELEAQALALIRRWIPVARNALKAFRRLTSATTDMVVAAFEAKSSDLRLKTERNEFVIAQLAQLPRDQAHIGVKIAERLVAEQHRLDEVVFAGVRHLADSEETSPTEPSRDELDDDWLEVFGREAVQRSHVEVREAFARILAGEIRQSGTFSIRALRTVNALSQSMAALFHRAASLRVGIEVMATTEGGGQRFMILDARVPALDGQLGANALQEEGLGYAALTELTENGLLQSDYGSWHDYRMAIPDVRRGGTVVLPLVHQNHKWALVPQGGSPIGPDVKVSGAGFTAAGKKLLSIVDIEEDSAFLERVQAYFRSRYFAMAQVPDQKK